MDRVLTHKVWGYVIFFLILFIIFNPYLNGLKFRWTLSMRFASLSTLAAENLPAGVLTNLISQGIIPELVEF
jgi:ferrous iron transport protein B